MVDITSKLVSIMTSSGISKVSDSTRKSLRQKLEVEFGNSLTFFTENHHVCFTRQLKKRKHWQISCHPN